ncbi:hypothetical protein [Cupriavidus taiwanensis]|uniref:hypothetical protein n=1 Tax=Cupriavidus taiwanensis TaxID=164546 RepID=UPI000E105758|nr:hypothetical protein [Cupriavidus taiwanensis]SOY56886.1 hypothetical protein CBM2592_A90172 [Cupriavidus taiwanensis]SOY90837.1 hypothetical protein CBM2591_A90172 [Cupriavidus taiwanensis]SOZ82643.1 hypothetical protein CBM2618_A80151 [Cupriavidus taiwanensis]SOZ92215.1 hypothetical protein CBM2621_A80150 [Cupriavidus taiwanensis]SPA17096.1 hypothetical protein CBM2631_A90172 [Cupriavidus taiwanensis]
MTTEDLREGGGLEEAKRIAEGVAGIFSAMQALCVSDPEVESLCQVGVALSQNLNNELEVAAAEGKIVRRIPVIGTATLTEG